MNRLQRKLMSMQNTLYLIPTAKRETYPISVMKRMMTYTTPTAWRTMYPIPAVKRKT
ncbi:hypothetical protein DPEC_G00158350 [Dallia pectoralis]|uniref:Uncharacterized protein n=1 Tax=Dallia pectoralis TaxID=75939 RepID=A0ACC2GL42_DALPE|nr:hypothetical protein DPEC_G00158350 [Dallia pectoralis]